MGSSLAITFLVSLKLLTSMDIATGFVSPISIDVPDVPRAFASSRDEELRFRVATCPLVAFDPQVEGAEKRLLVRSSGRRSQLISSITMAA